jgi:A/G-specific adenine glycosylase
MEDLCSLCEPVADQCVVTAYPMKADRKRARVELDVVSVVEWRLSSAADQRWFLLVRRPEKGRYQTFLSESRIILKWYRPSRWSL